MGIRLSEEYANETVQQKQQVDGGFADGVLRTFSGIHAWNLDGRPHFVRLVRDAGIN
jgi:hypothetical protein